MVITPIRHFNSRSILLAVTIAMVVVATMTVTTLPVITLGILATWCVAASLTFGEGLGKVFLITLGIVLIGYAFLGRGFAYVGVPPLFIGEVTIVLGLLAFVVILPRVRVTPTQVLLLGIMAFGCIRTLPYMAEYNVNALRDAALWYYGLVALFLASLLERHHFEIALAWASKLLPILVVWLSVTALFGRFSLPMMPSFPGTGVPIFYVKPGDRAVMLGAAAALVIVGLYARGTRKSQSPTLIWAIWLMGVGVVSIMTRGGMITIAAILLVVFLLNPSRRWLKPAAIAITFILALILIDPTLPSGYGGRALSTSQFMSNFSSIFNDSDTSNSGLSDTRHWRMSWWTDVWNYTVNGPYFWQGKGFGINLANADGYQVLSGEALRSPHNSHITFLARMGVPGLVAWIALQLTFLIQILAAHGRARKNGDRFWARIHTWILAVWLGMVVNASFDVYLEGPQGGIWFWAIFGAGLAAMRIQEQQAFDGGERQAGWKGERPGTQAAKWHRFGTPSPPLS